MQNDLWRTRWRDGDTRWHEGKPNAFLARFADRLHGRVLVPLCGKSEDLAFLAARGHDVVGVELVEDGARAFFAEHGLTPDVRGNVYTSGRITIVVGDFFEVAVEPCDSVFDRAALIALPPDLRTRYVERVRALAPRGLLVTLEYPPGAWQGPPFAVMETEVRALYASAELLGEDTTRLRPDAPEMLERCFAVTL